MITQIRPELKFDSLDDLIKEIRDDGEFCSKALDAHSHVAKDPFFYELIEPY